jgi:hypothetical protein
MIISAAATCAPDTRSPARRFARTPRIFSNLLGSDFTTGTPRRQAWIAATLTAFRHRSALHVQSTGQPALRRDDDEATFESLISSFRAERIRDRRTGSGHPMAAAL